MATTGYTIVTQVRNESKTQQLLVHTIVDKKYWNGLPHIIYSWCDLSGFYLFQIELQYIIPYIMSFLCECVRVRLSDMTSLTSSIPPCVNYISIERQLIHLTVMATQD